MSVSVALPSPAPPSPTPTSSGAAEVRCPTEQALEVIASKWTVQIIYSLHGGQVLRFSALKRALGNVTHKELTRQLRRLEQHGLVSRQIFAEVPPRVEYSLTPLGTTLVPPLQALSAWASEHGVSVIESRRRFQLAAAEALTAE